MAKKPTGEPAAFSNGDDLFSLFTQPAAVIVQPPEPVIVVEEPPPPLPAGPSAMTPAGTVVKCFCITPEKVPAMLELSAIVAAWHVTLRGPIVLVVIKWDDYQNHRNGIATYTANLTDCTIAPEKDCHTWGWSKPNPNTAKWKLDRLTRLDTPFSVSSSWGFFDHTIGGAR